MKKTLRLASAILFLFLYASFALAQQLEIHTINVGWGDSVFVKGPNGTTVLMEAGNTGKGTARVVPYLQSIGVAPANGLDYTFIGHQHCDHAGGMDEVIQAGYNVHIKNYYNGSTYSSTCVTEWNSAAATTTAGAPVAVPVGTIIDLGNGAKITVIARNGSIIGGGTVAVSDENDRSIALLIQYGGFDYLWASDMGGGTDSTGCTGRSTAQVDVETSVIQAISPGGAAPLITAGGIDVLAANHHGSESSTNFTYMNMTKPSTAIIATGDGQDPTWNLPRIDVVDKVLLAQATSCVTVPAALTLQTEEGAPAGSLTSFSGYSVGNIKITTDGVSTYTVSADGGVTQGPNETASAGLPKTIALDDAGGTGGDTTPPVISNVQSSGITSSSAVITWSTDENSNSVVEYGITTAYGSTASDATMTLAHSLGLSGLTASTVYHFRVKSSDAAGNTAASADNTFTTGAGSGGGGGTHVVISEVFYDTPGTDSAEEWIELFNPTATTADISGWTLIDNNGTGTTYTIPAGTTLRPRTFLTIAANQSGFKALYNRDADVYGSIPALNNTGETLLLRDGSGATVDAVAWEGGAGGLPTGWGSATDPVAPTGSTIVRTNPDTDTDTYADWSVAANNGNPQTQTVSSDFTPGSLTIITGALASGSVSSLATNDAVYAKVNSAGTSPKTEFNADATVSIAAADVIGMTVTYDGKYSVNTVAQKLYLFNNTTGLWDQVDSRNVSKSDVTVNVTPASPGNYVSASGQVSLKVVSTKTSSFATSADYVHFQLKSYSPALP